MARDGERWPHQRMDLQPRDCADPSTGPLWAEHDIGSDNENGSPVAWEPYVKETELTPRRAEMERLQAEVKVWQGHAKMAIWSDSEECKMLTRINEALIAAPTVDVDVVVPDRDYSAMTLKDCYEAGLLDGVYQAREAIKAATRAALEERT